MGRLKGGTPIKKRRWEVDVPLKQGGVRIKLANPARRDNMRYMVFRFGAREVYSPPSKRSTRQSSAVCAIGAGPSGISERSPLAKQPQRKRSH